MNTAKEIRLHNLRSLIAEFQTIRRVSELGGSSRVYLSQILIGVPSSTGTARGIGDDLARRLERGCGKPVGWMDYVHESITQPRSKRA